MSNELQDLAPLAAIAISLIVIAVGSALLPRHPRQDVVPPAGRRPLHTTVATVPPPGAHQQPTAQLAYVPQTHHRVHQEDPVTAVDPPTPPPSYLEYPSDTRVDGPVPIYNVGSSQGDTVNVVPLPGQDSPPQENADLDEVGEV